MNRTRLGISTLFLIGVFVFTLGCSNDESMPTGASLLPDSSSLSPGSGLALEEFKCTDVEEIKARFQEPGFVQGNEVGLYLKYSGMPSGRKKFRIWWDYDNDKVNYKDYRLDEWEVERNDRLFDVEQVIEFTYEGLNGTEKRRVRVELIIKEQTGNCARVREVFVTGDPASTATSTPAPAGPTMLKSQDTTWTSGAVRLGIGEPSAIVVPGFTLPVMLPGTATPSLAEVKSFFNTLGISVRLSDGSTFPDVLDGWGVTGNISATTVRIGPSAAVLEINDAAAAALLNGVLASLSQFEIKIIRTRAGVETEIYSVNLASAQIEVIDNGAGVEFRMRWDQAFDPTWVLPGDQLRYEVHAQ